ncbi:FAD-dependent oxidoreductase [Fulvivirga sediminis]|uniref:Kynurenine 3-monooxygenase n=1 Tax=Fulvivirga sediminis TaxID=2803949 RepID=A0A937F9W8_9BACT|nr:NAD(P)/FAD-dependent oxidoreductase [Fulvivirga sediminis]MBL3656974.1 FAD-dependent monooxygenase [Fulvivirga sediminis]
MNKVEKISIVGAGLVGSLMSVYLAKRGYKVSLFESRPDLRKADISAGRSINLALSNRGWLPLQEVGLKEKAEKLTIPMKGRMMHNEKGELTFQPYGKSGQAIYSISRSGLNSLLLDAAEATGVEVFFNQKCKEVDLNNNILLLNDKKISSDIIIGADGAFSVIRQAMEHTSRFNYSQQYLEHGYKELSIPPSSTNDFKIDKNSLHIWPRGNFMLIALPNLDGSFTCTLFFPFEGDQSFDQLHSDEAIINFFKKEFPDAYELMPDLLNDFHSNPTSALVTVRSSPWYKNRSLLIGDAAHAIVPFYGQGMNCGFEDCRVLNDLLTQFEDNWDLALPEYSQMRTPDANAISDLALKNFIEMRDHVADNDFLLRKKIEAKLNELYPEKWIPIYSMVTFNENIRYSKAAALGKLQASIMDKVMASPNLESQWEHLDFESIINQLPSM